MANSISVVINQIVGAAAPKEAEETPVAGAAATTEGAESTTAGAESATEGAETVNEHLENINNWVALSSDDSEIFGNLVEAFKGLGSIGESILGAFSVFV